MARILGVSEEDRLKLKAEIMGHPGEVVRTYLGDPEKAARALDVPRSAAEEILDEEKSVTHRSERWALEKLRETNAPAFVIESVDRRLMPPPEPRRGLITHALHGPEMAEQRKKTKESLKHGKPRTYEAIQRSGLMIKEIAERAGVGKETMRRALYGENLSARSARAIAAVLGERLSKEEIRALEDELRRPPRRDF